MALETFEIVSVVQARRWLPFSTARQRTGRAFDIEYAKGGFVQHGSKGTFLLCHEGVPMIGR